MTGGYTKLGRIGQLGTTVTAALNVEANDIIQYVVEALEFALLSEQIKVKDLTCDFLAQTRSSSSVGFVSLVAARSCGLHVFHFAPDDSLAWRGVPGSVRPAASQGVVSFPLCHVIPQRRFHRQISFFGASVLVFLFGTTPPLEKSSLSTRYSTFLVYPPPPQAPVELSGHKFGSNLFVQPCWPQFWSHFFVLVLVPVFGPTCWSHVW